MQFDGIVFPGQGTQFLGMGKDFIDQYEDAKRVFNVAEQALGFDLYGICQNNEAKLNNTEYTQPAILATEIAMYLSLKNNYGLSAMFFAGHSLGEYTALVAAEVIPFDVALQIVRFRGKLMQEAVIPNKDASMAAIIMDSLPLEPIQAIANSFGVDVANDNSIQQVVLSGYTEDVRTTVAAIESHWPNNRGMRVVYLAVKAPFHSRYMVSIEEPFKEFLELFKNKFKTDSLTSVISNYNGDFYPDARVETLIDGLTKQISGSVKWRQNMDALIKHAKDILEIGPASPLRGFFKSIGVNIATVTNVRSISKMLVSV